MSATILAFERALEEGEYAARELEVTKLSENAQRAYAQGQRLFKQWMSHQGKRTLPAEPDDVRRFLAVLDSRGYSYNTIVLAKNAIRSLHELNDHASPTSHPRVKAVMRGLGRRPKPAPRQAKGLTGRDLSALREWSQQPLEPKWNNTVAKQRYDRLLTVALVGVMRDALLRRCEAANLKWDDLQQDDTTGAGTLTVRRSKTDQSGQGAVCYVSSQVMADLASYRQQRMEVRGFESSSVFGIKPASVSWRIKNHCLAAGLGGEFSGHSPRVGMAQDLAAAGTPDYAIQNAGRWANSTMPARYTRAIRVHDNAVARLYKLCDNNGSSTGDGE